MAETFIAEGFDKSYAMEKREEEYVPSLDLFRTAKDFSAEDLSHVTQNIEGQNPAVDTQKLSRMFQNGLKFPLRSYIIRSKELRGLQRMIMPAAYVDDQHVEELGQYIDRHMPSFSGIEARVPTLPSRIIKNGKGTVLTVAGSREIVQERFIAKQALCGFYGTDPGETADVWLDDELVTGVMLLRASIAPDRSMLERLHVLLTADSSLLPSQMRFGPVEKVVT